MKVYTTFCDTEVIEALKKTMKYSIEKFSLTVILNMVREILGCDKVSKMFVHNFSNVQQYTDFCESQVIEILKNTMKTSTERLNSSNILNMVSQILVSDKVSNTLIMTKT